MDINLSTHFKLSEFACQRGKCPYCGDVAIADTALIDGLERLRGMFCSILNRDVPIIISSGYRCILWNEELTKRSDWATYPYSQHTLGRAADIPVIEGFTINEMAEAAREVPAFKKGGIKRYGKWLHLDVRTHGPYWV